MWNEKPIKITFFISLTGHLLLFGIPEDFFKFKPKVETPEDAVVRIEIETPPLLPKIEKIGKEKKLKEIKERISKPESKLEPLPEVKKIMPEPLPLEKIIPRPKPKFKRPILPEPKIEKEIEKLALIKPEPVEIRTSNPSNEAMLRYQDIVKQRIESARHYPSWARKQNIEGETSIKFTILSDGVVEEINLIRSSGFQILDKETIATIQRANPFPPIPKEINLSSIQMEISLIFTLKFDK